MKKVFLRFQAVKLLKNGKRKILMGRVEALDLGKQQEMFIKRGFQVFQYWVDDQQDNFKLVNFEVEEEE